MKDKQKISYTFLIGDLFHYEYLKLLQQAKEVSNPLIFKQRIVLGIENV